MLFISFEPTTAQRKRLAMKKYVKFSMCLELLIDKKNCTRVAWDDFVRPFPKHALITGYG